MTKKAALTKPSTPARDPKTRTMPLRLRGVQGRFTWDNDRIWAWYRLYPKRWSFLTDGERRGILDSQATGYGELLGRSMKLRVTYRSYKGAEWAERLDRDPKSKPVDLDAWDDMLRESQRLLMNLSTAEAEHYVGFEVGPRKPLDQFLDAALPHDFYEWVTTKSGISERILRRLKDDIDHVDQVVEQQLDGRPATSAEVDYLINRSRALCLPQVPTSADPNTLSEHSDLYAYSDGVEIEEHLAEPFVTVRDRRGDRFLERCVTVLTLGQVDRIAYPPIDLPLLALPLEHGFPVEISATGRLLAGEQTARGLRRQITRIQSQIGDYNENHLAAPPGLQRRATHAQYVGDEIDSPVPSVAGRWRGWIRMAVAGRTPQEVAERAGNLKRTFATRNLVLNREPQSRELVAEFMPHEPVGSGAYVRQMPVRMFGAFLPQVTSQIGDRTGPLIAHTTSGPRRPVMVHPQYGPENLDKAGLCGVIGGLGSGKSYLLGLIAEQAVLRGTGTTILDPSAGAFVRLAQLPYLRRHSRVIDLVHGRPGSLSPWAVISEPRRDHYDNDQEWMDAAKVAAQERMVLAEDICRSLLPIELANDQSLRLALTEAVHDTGGHPDQNLYHVIERLGTKGDVGGKAARFLGNMADYPRANLFFDTGATRESIDDTLVVITFSGLVIPNMGADRSTWSTEEQISVPLLNLATALAFRRIARKPRTERHCAIFDELGILENFASFRSMFRRFSRDSRKLNCWVGKADQTPQGLINLGLLPFIGSAFVGVTDDDEAAMDSLRILGLKPEARWADVLRRLPRSTPEKKLKYRDFVYRDPAGLVERIRVTSEHRPLLEATLDTTPNQANDEHSAA